MCGEDAVGVRVGTVENMDVFYEPTRTYLRRVPQTRTRRPKPGTFAEQGCSPICVTQPGATSAACMFSTGVVESGGS